MRNRYFSRDDSLQDVPMLNTASLPDLIFTVLFFFMIVTHMREVNLKVHYEEGITTSVLMKNAIPSHHYTDINTAGPETFRTDNLDGLYYNDTEAVRNSQIFKLGIGASKWREGIGK